MNRIHALIHRFFDLPLLNSPFMPLTNWWAQHIWNETSPVETSQEFKDRIRDLLDRA